MARLTGRHISDTVGDAGWRYVLRTLRASVRVGSLTEALTVAARVVEAAGVDADGSLVVDARRDRLVVTLQSAASVSVTERELGLAQRIAAAVGELGLRLDPEVAGTAAQTEEAAQTGRSVQILEIAIDALDILSIRPFWKAVLGYTDEPGAGPQDAIVDPVGQGPAVWFQQMDQPRTQRNRIHFDVSVPHDEAPHRIQAALAAGGRVVSDVEAPAFWVLADAEGNEACVTTWQGRD
jgi:4a-hydroxytetrahydrobiopterin dehydratase